jgi:broad specificity phosphatase PhoE
MAFRLILVRHGQSEGNASGVVQGHLDFGLSELGRLQAEATARRLAAESIDRVVASPLLRAHGTAEAIADALGLEVEAERGLLEYDIGVISGLTGPQIRERFPEIAAAFARGERPRFEGEEGRDVFLARIREVLERLRSLGGTSVAVAHGGVVGAACYAALGLDYTRPGMFQAANCSITELVEGRHGGLVLQRHNDTCHLRGLTSLD